MKNKILLGFIFVVLLVATMTSALADLTDAVESMSFNNNSAHLQNDGSSGNTYTNTGATRVLQSSDNYAFDFDGTNDELLYSGGIIGFDADRTISMWVNISSAFGGAKYFYSGLQYSAPNSVQIDAYYDGSAITIRRVKPAVGALTSSYTVNLNDNTYHHVLIDYDNSTGIVRLYLDNVLRATTGSDTAYGTGVVTSENNFGSRIGQLFFDGGIDQPMLYNRRLSASERTEIYNGGTIYNPYATPTPPGLDNFSTVSSASYAFTTPVSIGASFGTVNSITLTSDNATVPYYITSVLTTNASSASTAVCRVSVDGSPVQTETRTLGANTLGNLKIITSPLNLSLGNHTVITECQKSGGANYEITNSELVTFHLYDINTATPITYQSINATGLAITTTDTELATFSFTTDNTTNTTNLPSIIVHGRASYVYSGTSEITTYLKNVQTGEVCGNYTRFGSGTGSVGTACNFENLNSSTLYNFSFHGFTTTGTGSIDNLLMNVYDINVNDTATNNVELVYSVPNNTETVVATVNITNVLGGNYNVFVDSGIMVTGNASEDAYFYLNNTESSIRYYRTLSTSGSGNINTMYVFSESGTGVNTYDLVAYCPSGCEIISGDLTAFVTDASTASTGEFTINAYNAYNSTSLSDFNATIGGTTYTTTNGTITAIAQGTASVTIEATNFFSNTTSHDTTTALNASMAKYTEFRVNEYGGGSVNNYTVNMTGYTYTTTNGVAYLPTDNSTVSFNSPLHSLDTQTVNKTQYYNFTVYAENSLLITFKDSVTESVINNVSMDYFSSLDSDNVTTTDGTFYLTLLNPVSYTFRISSAGYTDNLYFTTITNDTYEELTIYLNTNSSTTISVEIVDGGASPVANAQVQALKYYVSDNTYRVVGSGVTNPDGETNIGLITGTNFYKFVVVVGGETVKTTDPFIITGTTVRIQVLIGDDVLADYETWRNIDSTMVFNTLTNNFRFEYSSPVNRQVCMSTYKKGFVTDTLLNTTCVTGTTGTILQGVTNNSGDTYYAKATTTIGGSPSIIGYETHTFNDFNIGSSGLIGQLFLTLVLSLAGFVAIELIFLMAPLSIIIGGIVGLHTISLGVTIPLVIIGIISMFMLRRNS